MLIRVFLTVLTAFLFSALVAPWYFGFLHWGLFLPMFWVLRSGTNRANFGYALLFGTVAEAFIFSWIAETVTLFSNIPEPGAYTILVLFSVVYGVPLTLMFAAVQPLRRRLGTLWVPALPALVVLIEWVDARVILFPYQQGVSQFLTPWVWQLASVTGVAGISFLVVFVNAALGEALYRRMEGRPMPWGWLGAAALMVAGTVAFGAWRTAAVDAVLAQAPVKRVLQIQSQHGMQYRMSRPASEEFSFWVETTRATAPGKVDLVVWPEAAVPYQLNASTATSTLWSLTEQGDFDLVVGAGTRERDADVEQGEQGRVRVFNSTYFFAREARKVPADAPGPLTDVQALAAAGCDLDRGHVFVGWEAAVLAQAGTGVVDAACVDALRARALQLGAPTRGTDAFAAAMEATPDLFVRLRAQTARFAAPLVERGFASKRGIAVWTLREASCTDDDCRGITIHCEDGGTCKVYPEPLHYDKMVPLPFGEYLPFAETFPWLADIIKGPGNFRAGTEAVVFDADGVRFGTPICYEGILTYVCDRFDDVDLLVNVTNDAWFGTGAASALHGMLAASRAVELGMPVFRSAYSGLSFVVEPHGRIHSETELFTEVARPVEVRLARFSTVYARWGDWFTGVCGLVFAACVALARRGSW